ncbi:acyl-CoA N-acyltransferase [Podospora fimiseda]|uniref:Acyl-CoA N-acyltransferase n=1 Tax=Podospora fimiseda TaxID=252190 RepID=A0AAN7BRF7_9PEZI|nr:acyl-CoA N-acyltransferase [Podospora fimiseda]
MAETPPSSTSHPGNLKYIRYDHSLETKYLPAIRALISKDLSEPYSIYVYRYFLYQWGHLCFLALHPTTEDLIGVIICKLEPHISHSPPTLRGYIAMLAVSSGYRGHGIATTLVKMGIEAMTQRNADEVVLETEETNIPAMRLYERLGFLRSKKLHRYYLNGSSAYRLVLLLKNAEGEEDRDFDAEGMALDEDEIS